MRALVQSLSVHRRKTHGLSGHVTGGAAPSVRAKALKEGVRRVRTAGAVGPDISGPVAGDGEPGGRRAENCAEAVDATALVPTLANLVLLIASAPCSLSSIPWRPESIAYQGIRISMRIADTPLPFYLRRLRELGWQSDITRQLRIRGNGVNLSSSSRCQVTAGPHGNRGTFRAPVFTGVR